MAEKTQGQMIQETHQGLFGVEGTEDKGLVGDIKEIKSDVGTMKRDMNGKFDEVHKRVSKLSTKVWLIVGVLVSSGGGVGIWQLIEKLNG